MIQDAFVSCIFIVVDLSPASSGLTPSLTSLSTASDRNLAIDGQRQLGLLVWSQATRWAQATCLALSTLFWSPDLFNGPQTC